MSLRREILLSFGIQGAGAASVLLAALLLGATFGPEVQGGFSRAKAEIEFIAALALFGLPQALFFHVKSGRLGLSRALRFALAQRAGRARDRRLLRGGPAWPRPVRSARCCSGVAVAACVAHGQLRAMTLLDPRTEWFNVVTAAPQVLIFLLVAVVCAGSVNAAVAPVWWTIFAVAFGIGAGARMATARALDDAPGGWRSRLAIASPTTGWRHG